MLARTTVEAAIDAFENHGLNPLSIAMMCDALYGARDTLAGLEDLVAEAEDGADAWGACSHEWLRINAVKNKLHLHEEENEDV